MEKAEEVVELMFGSMESWFRISTYIRGVISDTEREEYWIVGLD